jgi:hypothetical protein
MSPALCRIFRCRGDRATAADVACFGDTSLYSSARRHASPLAVAASNTRLGRQQMLATLLSNDQASGSRAGGKRRVAWPNLPRQSHKPAATKTRKLAPTP